jgi:hypothetical protein
MPKLLFALLISAFFLTAGQFPASCEPVSGANLTYSNEKHHIAFEHASDLKINFSVRSENSGVLTAVADPGIATITLTINGPAVTLDPMQKAVTDESVTINGIPMRKRIIADPAVGRPPHELEEIIYDFTHKGSTFTWWAVFHKNDTKNQERMDRIIESFKFTD